VNLDQAREAVKDRGFDYLSGPRLDMMLNTAKDEFEDWWHWPWLQVIVTGPTPLVVSDLKLVLMVKATGTHDELLGLDLAQVGLGLTDLAARGTPEYWWIAGDKTLHAYPGDGASLDLVYVADSPPLVDPDDTPLIPARYHGLWIDLAVCEAYKDSDNFPGAQALRGDVAIRMHDVITRYETRNRQHSPFVTVRGYSEDE
jgi:hypothetical protein